MSETTAVAGQTSRPRARALTRRRRENAPGGRRHRHSVLVTPEEEGLLVRLAAEQGVTVPRLLVEAATAERAGETATDRRELLTELFGVHRALGAVGEQPEPARPGRRTRPVTCRWKLEHTLAAVRRSWTRLDDTLRRARQS